jgi:hypothetical protein
VRYLELLVTDVPGITDARDPGIRTEWIHRDHIETIEPYLEVDPGRDMLWLQLTLTSGRARYVPLRPVRPEDADDVARAAITTLLESPHPLHAAALDTNPGGGTESTALTTS